MRLTLEGVRLELGGRTIVRDVALDVPDGRVAGLIGPNGSGKSTLLRAVYRHLQPSAGAVLVGGEDCWQLPPRRAAQRLAAVAQERPVDLELTVWEVAAMGRTPYKGAFARDDATDREAVAEALDRVGLLPLARRRFAELSGGEKQRVVVARALAQKAPTLVLDEPTNHLDIRHQLDVLELVRDLGVTALAAMHDLNLASTYCDHLHVLQGGGVVAAGSPAEVLTEALLAEVFGVGADVTHHPRSGRPQLSFRPLGAGPPAGAREPGDHRDEGEDALVR